MFVLVNIQSVDTRKNVFPLGLAYVAASYEKYGKVKVFDLHYENNIDELLDYLYENVVKFVGFSVCSSHESISQSSYLAKFIKRISPNTIIGIGGQHPTYQGKEIIQHHMEFDVAFIGEGELSAVQLAKNISAGENDIYRNVNNIIYRNQENEMVISEYKKNDIYHLPARHLFNSCKDYAEKFNEKLPVICIESTRGCVGKCSFCALKLDQERSFVKKDLDLFYKDLDITLSSQNLEKVDLFIVDADFLISKDRTIEILNIIKQFPQVRYFNIASCADSIIRSKDILDDLFNCGCTYIEIGIESFSGEQLKRFNKRSSLQTGLEAIKLLNEKQRMFKFSYKVDMIMFEPFATLEDIKISNEYLQKYTYASPINEINFFHVMDLFPGTRYRLIAENDKISLPATEMDIPFWRFKDLRVAELYKYVLLYRRKILSQKNEIICTLEERINKAERKELCTIKDLRVLRTMTYDWFNEMINAKDTSHYMDVFIKYYEIYNQIREGVYKDENNC